MHRITTERGVPQIILINFGDGQPVPLKEKTRPRRVSMIAVANATHAPNARPAATSLIEAGMLASIKKPSARGAKGEKRFT
jgi:hypothetical protein